MFQKYWKNNKRHLLMPFEAVLNRNKKVLKSTDFSTFMVRVVIQNFLKKPVISTVFKADE